MRIGETAPDIVFLDARATPVPLWSLRGEPTLLILTRHLG
ncbi:MAG: hypothetical protein QOK29_5522 [Rhodospirillaceae bacterium]|nr:hypothetical protein [Miltoncostaeaceae bacterium]MEA2783890.1 hypothetical protein [Rhodospirillaceae bacterium]